MTTHQQSLGDFTTSPIEELNQQLIKFRAEDRVRWAIDHLPGTHVLTSSFGAQAAVSLHMVTRVRPDVPVVLIDTGYLFPETYRFVDELTQRLQLNLIVYRSELSPAWQEARHGQRWTHGLGGVESYNEENKVEPMRRALRDLEVGTWFVGLRRSQARSRTDLEMLRRIGERWKVHPIVDWTDRDIHEYLEQHRLPRNPLWHRGYESIGDTHTTRPVDECTTAEQSRFFGLKRECGLHEMEAGCS